MGQTTENGARHKAEEMLLLFPSSPGPLAALQHNGLRCGQWPTTLVPHQPQDCCCGVSGAGCYVPSRSSSPLTLLAGVAWCKRRLYAHARSRTHAIEGAATGAEGLATHMSIHVHTEFSCLFTRTCMSFQFMFITCLCICLCTCVHTCVHVYTYLLTVHPVHSQYT